MSVEEERRGEERREVTQYSDLYYLIFSAGQAAARTLCRPPHSFQGNQDLAGILTSPGSRHRQSSLVSFVTREGRLWSGVEWIRVINIPPTSFVCPSSCLSPPDIPFPPPSPSSTNYIFCFLNCSHYWVRSSAWVGAGLQHTASSLPSHWLFSWNGGGDGNQWISLQHFQPSPLSTQQNINTRTLHSSVKVSQCHFSPAL